MTILLQDTFTDTDGTALASHTMNVGSGWTVHGSTWTIQSNRATGTGNMATAQANAADITATLTVRNTGNGSTGLICRFSSTTAAWLVGVGNSGGKIQVVIWEINPGFTNRASVISATSYATATDYPLTVTCNGNTISGVITGIPDTAVSYNSATFNNTATRFGLRVGDSGDAFDGFQVDDLGAARARMLGKYL